MRRHVAVFLVFLGSGMLFLSAAVDFPWWIVVVTMGALAIFAGVAGMAADDDDSWPPTGGTF